MSWRLQPKWLAFFAFASAATVLAALRLTQLEVEQPAESIRFSMLHEMRWTPATGTLAPTGLDPHGFLEIPDASVPLTGLTLEFAGSPMPGPSYIYPSPAHFPGIQTSDATIVVGRVESIDGGFRLHYAIPPSRAARFDLPDALDHAVALRKIVFRTHFVGSSNTVFSLFAGCVAGALLTLFWSLAGPLIARHRSLELSCLLLLVAAKLWLIAGLSLTIFPFAMHDDALFLQQGHSIANGDWLGTFGELTLSKGPTFPIFIALVQLTRIPFLTAEAAFHALACLALLLALRPLVRSAGLRLALFGLLLFDPHTLSIQVVAQVLRSGIQPALTLFALAGFIGLLTRVRASAWLALPWAVLAGVAFSFFWYCREEGIWLLPSALVLGGTALWLAWRAGPVGRLPRVALVLLPALIWFGSQTALRAVNQHYYHGWITIDVKDGGYPAAYAALTRITPQERISGVPVTQATRLRAYAFSPAFATLEPFLEGATGRNWSQLGWEGIDHPRARLEMRGWFQWALRQAAREAGHYQDAGTASAFWQRVADEINAACDDGRLAAGPKRNGFFPRWDHSLWPVLGQSLLGAVDITIRFSDFNSQPTPSDGDPAQITFYARMLHERPALGREPPTARTHLSLVLFHLYGLTGGLATGFAFAGFIAFGFFSWKRRANLVPFAILCALAGGALALIVIVALVDATSFSTVHAIYLSAATPLLLACWLLAPAWAIEAARNTRVYRWINQLELPLLTAPSSWPWPSSRKLALAAAVVFTLLALLSGIVRWRQTSTAIPGRDVGFSMLHDMTWDPATHRLTRTGADPFGSLHLAEHTFPIRELEINFAGSYERVQGVFYTFQYPASLPGFGTDGDTMQEARVTPHADGFTASWTLQDTKVVRLDLPDFLIHPIEIREIRLKTTYAWLGSTAFRGLLGFSAAALFCLAWSSFTHPTPRRRLLFASAVAILVVLHLSLVSDLPFSVYGSAAHDDALFITQADTLMHGQWLGAFNEITLAKGPVYSFFLALNGLSGLRLEITQALLRAVASLAFVLALRPLVSSRPLRLLLFAVLLFDPQGFSVEVVGRPLRSGIQPALTLLALAGALGLALRLAAPPRRLVAWSLLAGVAGSLFWFCREEGPWLVPSLGVILAVGVFTLVRARLARDWRRWTLLALPCGIFLGATWTLRLANACHYGAPITVDVKDGHFPRAYGALTRITPAERIPLVPVTKETRLRAYAVSPAFRELEPFLEGPLGDGWSQPGWEDSTHPRAKKEMRGGWFQWALRQAAAQAGHYRDARSADDYWRRVANEIDAACDRGDLAAGPARAGFFPHWDASLWPDLRDAWRRAYGITTRTDGFVQALAPSDATSEQQRLFRRVTHENASDGDPSESAPRTARVYVFLLYRFFGAWLPPLAALATLVLAWRAIVTRSRFVEVAVLLTLLGGAFSLITLVALVHAASFSAINGSYLSPASPLSLAACVLAPVWTWQTLRQGSADSR